MSISRRAITSLNTEINPYAAPEGSLSEATNVVIRRAGIVQPRPGLKQSADYSNVEAVQHLSAYDGEIIILDDEEVHTTNGGGSEILDQDSESIELFDGFCSTTVARGNLYLGSEKGVQKITRSSSSPTADWAGLDGIGEIDVTPAAGTGAWLADGDMVGYRVQLSRTDANDLKVFSRFSAVFKALNSTGNPAVVNISAYLTEEPREGDVIRVYRSAAHAGSSGRDVIPPTDLYLAMEVTLTTTHIVAGVVGFTDETAQEDLGEVASLNTLPNHGPPIPGKVLGSYADSMFVANTITREFVKLQGTPLLPALPPAFSGSTTSGSPDFDNGSPPPSYVVEGMIVDSPQFPTGTQVASVAGNIITMDENATATTGSAALTQIYDAVQITDGTTTELYVRNYLHRQIMSHATVISVGTTTGPSALVRSVPTTDFIESSADAVGYSHVQLHAIRGGVQLQIKATNAPDGINEWADGYGNFEEDREPALIQWSKKNQPEHFVKRNQRFIGDLNAEILDAVSQEDYFYIFKQDGIYTFQGESEVAGFRLEQLSRSHVLMSPRHACHTPYGVAAWTDQGVILIRRGGSIENLSDQRVSTRLTPYFATTDVDELAGNMFYAESELHVIAQRTVQSTILDFHLVYNFETDAWTEWQVKGANALVGCAPGGELAGGSTATLAIVTDDNGEITTWQRFRYDDPVNPEAVYGDRVNTPDNFTVTNMAATSEAYVYTFTRTFSGATIPEPGDMFYSAADSWKALILTRVPAGGAANTYTIYSRDSIPIGTTNFDILYAYPCTVRLMPQAGADPTTWHRWRSAHWHFVGSLSIYEASVGVRSGDSSVDDTVTQRTRAGYANYTEPGEEPNQRRFAPRYLFKPRHASSQYVEPVITIQEAGAIWSLAAVSLDEVTVSKKRERRSA